MTTISAPPPSDVPFGAVFSASWRVFKANWTIALPPVIGGVVVMIAVAIYIAAVFASIGIAGWRAILASSNDTTLPPSVAATLIGSTLVGGVILAAVAILVTLWAYTAMYGMADAAWTRGTATLADGFAAFRARAGAVFVAGIGITVLAIVALVLAIFTLFLSVIALTVVMLFVMPAAVGGRLGGFDAIGESYRLIRRFFVPSIITWLVLYAIQYGISFLSVFAIVPLELTAMPTTPNGPPTFPPVPLIAFSGVMYIVSLVLLLAYNGFRATVQVGLYRELQARSSGTTLFPPPPPPALSGPVPIVPSS